MAQPPCSQFCCFPEDRDPLPFPAVNYWCEQCHPSSELPWAWVMRTGWITYVLSPRPHPLAHNVIYRPQLSPQRVRLTAHYRDLPRPIQIRLFKTCGRAYRAYHYNSLTVATRAMRRKRERQRHKLEQELLTLV